MVNSAKDKRKRLAYCIYLKEELKKPEIEWFY